jgi:predicted ribosome quality control (RQC) complex YloA/Tae2 family protein
MLENKDLKAGQLIWWADEFWSCPCVIVSVGDLSFKVESLDNFRESGDLRIDAVSDRSPRGNMRTCTVFEAEEYFRERKRELKKQLRDLEDKVLELKEKKANYERRADEFLATLKCSPSEQASEQTS